MNKKYIIVFISITLSILSIEYGLFLRSIDSSFLRNHNQVIEEIALTNNIIDKNSIYIKKENHYKEEIIKLYLYEYRNQLYLQVFKKDNSSRYHTFAFFDPISSNQTMLYYYNIHIDNQNLVVAGGYNQNNYIDHYKLYDSNINEINKIISNQKYILDIYTCDTVLSVSAYGSDGNQLE